MTTLLYPARLFVALAVLGAGIGVLTSVVAGADSIGPNGRIAFTDFEEGEYQVNQVFTVNPDGSDQNQVTTETEGGVKNPHWTSDGRHIISTTRRGDGVLVTAADGSGRRWLLRTPTSNDSRYEGARLSPDGQRLLSDGLSTYPVDGGEPSAIAPLSGATDGSWSSDGSQLVFAIGSVGGVDLGVANSDGSGLRRFPTEYVPREPRLSPLGTRALYTVETSAGGSEIHMVDLASGGDIEIVRSATPMRSATFSPDGTKIAFARAEPDYAWKIYIANADGSDQRAIATGTWIDDLDWQRIGGTAVPDLPASSTTTYPNSTSTTEPTTTTTTSAPTVNQPPQPVIGTARSPKPRQVRMAADRSRDPDGSVVAYQWRWGDGSPPTSGRYATHEYASPGAYVVTLTITDDRGATSTARLRMRVMAR